MAARFQIIPAETAKAPICLPPKDKVEDTGELLRLKCGQRTAANKDDLWQKRAEFPCHGASAVCHRYHSIDTHQPRMHSRYLGQNLVPSTKGAVNNRNIEPITAQNRGQLGDAKRMEEHRTLSVSIKVRINEDDVRHRSPTVSVTWVYVDDCTRNSQKVHDD
jgi:hypothetical protein